MLYVLRTMTVPTANLGEIPCYFFGTPQKSAKRLEQKRSSDTAPPLVTRGGYVVV